MGQTEGPIPARLFLYIGKGKFSLLNIKSSLATRERTWDYTRGACSFKLLVQRKEPCPNFYLRRWKKPAISQVIQWRSTPIHTKRTFVGYLRLWLAVASTKFTQWNKIKRNKFARNLRDTALFGLCYIEQQQITYIASIRCQEYRSLLKPGLPCRLPRGLTTTSHDDDHVTWLK